MTTKRRGREKLHFLDPSRSGSSTSAGSASTPSPGPPGSAGSNTTSRRATMSAREPWEVVDGRAMAAFEIYIKTTPERLWEAIVDPELRSKPPTSGSGSPLTGLRLRVRFSPAGSRSPPARTWRPRLPPRARADLPGALERQRQGRRDLAGDLGDRAGRRFLPAFWSPTTSCPRAPTANSSAAGGSSLRSEDPAGDGRAVRRRARCATRRPAAYMPTSMASPGSVKAAAQGCGRSVDAR